ncbi:MAG: penicillin-binding protein 2, partial [Campylobacterales bacterium]
KGLEISENQFIRFYPYIETLEPLVGYVRKDSLTGIVGIEKQYDQYLSPQRDATLEGVRDVGGNIILNKISSINYHEDGYDLELSIMMPLQKELEETLTAYRNDLQADEVMAAVMESKTGRILAIASSNRYTPNAIKPRDVPSIKLGMIQYIFEPGSIIKPIVFSILLDRGKLSPDQMINGYGGRYTMGTKVITDEHKMGIMRAEEAIIYSSNIAMAQLSQRLEAEEYIEGLRGFGFAQKSGIDLPYEYSGDIPTLSQMRSEIYKATVSYGYGMRANFMQLLKAYNVFNNDGKLITPRVGLALRNGHTRYTIEQPQPVQIISPRTAQTMMSILRKTVTEGTGKKTDIEGVLIGGKTGTAHIARAGRYQNFYNSSFFGYANDAKHRYTIGTVVINPKTSYFASETAAPIFRSIVERMGKRGMIYIPPLPDTNTTDSFTGHFPQVQ